VGLTVPAPPMQPAAGRSTAATKARQTDLRRPRQERGLLTEVIRAIVIRPPSFFSRTFHRNFCISTQKS